MDLKHGSVLRNRKPIVGRVGPLTQPVDRWSSEDFRAGSIFLVLNPLPLVGEHWLWLRCLSMGSLRIVCVPWTSSHDPSFWPSESIYEMR